MNNNGTITISESGPSAAEIDRENYNNMPTYKIFKWYTPLVVSMMLKVVTIYHYYSIISIVILILEQFLIFTLDATAFIYIAMNLVILVSNRSEDDVKKTKIYYYLMVFYLILSQKILYVINLIIASANQNCNQE